MLFSTAEYLTSTAQKGEFPSPTGPNGQPLPEIAFVGKSNVGKSSLLNHLTRQKNLARVSATPGKTQMINFFLVNRTLCLVDLPGYGFAKVPKKIRQKWGGLMDSYFTDRPSLKLILLLIDSRHPPSQEDLSFAEWISHHNYPFLIVFTKTDKVKPGVLQKQIDQSFAELQRAMKGSSTASLAYSIHEPKPRIVLEKLIEEYISWD